MSSTFGSSGGGGLRSKIEGSTIIDLMTVGVLGYNFTLLKDQGYGNSSIMQLSGEPTIIAAQLTGLLLVIYVLEAIIDSSGSGH